MNLLVLSDSHGRQDLLRRQALLDQMPVAERPPSSDLAHGQRHVVRGEHPPGLVLPHRVRGDADHLGPVFLAESGTFSRVSVDIAVVALHGLRTLPLVE